MKSRTLLVCLLCLPLTQLPAQTIDINAARSAEQLRYGVQAFHRGFFNDAWASLEKAVSYQPANTLAQLWLGRAQWKAGYEQEALRTWQQVVDSGRGTALVRDWINVLTFRRGLGRELSGGTTWVVSSELAGTLKTGHQFLRPTSVRPRPDGSFWVVAFGSNEVLKFDANFRLMDAFRGGLAGFDRPYDVVESDGSFFVSEYGADRIAKCSPQGEKIATFGATGRGDGQLLGPQYLALDSRGSLWVTDWGNSRVVRFDTDGKFIQSVSGISHPTGIAAFEDRLYVSEKAAKRVLVYDLNGNFLSSIGEGVLEGPEGLSFTKAGTLLVADGNRIMECDLEREVWNVRGDTSAHTARLVQQAMTSNGDILGVDFDQSKVILLSDVSALYSGLVVRVDRVNAVQFPDVYADVSVENRFGRPVVGLGISNFVVTESGALVGSATLALANTNVKAVDVSLLIERSPAVEQYRSDAEQAVADLYGSVTGGGGRIKAISAGEKPTREADFGETRLRFIRQAFQAPASTKWRFDLAAKMAGDELITAVSGAKRAVVFMTAGVLGSGAFSTYSVTEVAAFLKNNSIAFYPVLFGSQPPDEDITFLAAETGGKVFKVSSPGGMQEVVQEIKGRITSLYTLRYKSPTPPEFGEKYIPLEVQVTVQKESGRDEAGYYAPPSTGSAEK